MRETNQAGTRPRGPVAADDILDPGWVDEVLLAGDPHQVCLDLGGPVRRDALRDLVRQREAALRCAGLTGADTVALVLPPSIAYVANLLAGWRIGARVCLLDHRLTPYEIEQALRHIGPSVVVSAGRLTGGLRAFHHVTETVVGYPGRPSDTGHAVLQLSSGSTGPSKVIGRTAADLVAEITRYTRLAGMPVRGERTVLLASMVHVLGLVGGLLYGLHAGVELDLPEKVSPDSVFATVTAARSPATLLGVPFHIELLAAVVAPPRLPQLAGMTTGGELVRASVHQSFVDRYQVRLGNMYGMTEVGVIATDLFAEHRPSLVPAPGISVIERDGELHVGRAASPYVGLADPTRWSDGWLRTRDAGTVDGELITILGRLDSQVSIGGLKVDLTEVEQTLAALPGVAGAVVVFDRGIEAYLMLTDPGAAGRVEEQLATRLAAYKRPKVLHVVDQLPRTATGKLVRDRAVLAAADRAQT